MVFCVQNTIKIEKYNLRMIHLFIVENIIEMLLHIIKDGMIVLPFFCAFYTSISILGCCRMVSLVSKADAFNVEFCHCVNIISSQRNWRTLYVEVLLDVPVIGVLARTSQEDKNIGFVISIS